MKLAEVSTESPSTRLLQLLLSQFQSHRKQIYLAIGLILVVSGNQRPERYSLTGSYGLGTTLPLLVWTSVPLSDIQPREWRWATKTATKHDKISELTSFLIFSPFYLVWSRMLCVSDASYISHNSSKVTIRLWWYYWCCGKQWCFRCGNRVRDSLSWRFDPSVRWFQSFEYLLLEWTSECLAYARQHWSVWGELYFIYSQYVLLI